MNLDKINKAKEDLTLISKEIINQIYSLYSLQENIEEIRCDLINIEGISYAKNSSIRKAN